MLQQSPKQLKQLVLEHWKNNCRKQNHTSYTSPRVIHTLESCHSSNFIWREVIYTLFKTQIFTAAAKLKALAHTLSVLADELNQASRVFSCCFLQLFNRTPSRCEASEMFSWLRNITWLSLVMRMSRWWLHFLVLLSTLNCFFKDGLKILSFFPPKAAASMEQKTIVKIRNIGKSVVISSDHYHAFSFNLHFTHSFLQCCSSLHCGHYKGVMKPIKRSATVSTSRAEKVNLWHELIPFHSAAY